MPEGPDRGAGALNLTGERDMMNWLKQRRDRPLLQMASLHRWHTLVLVLLLNAGIGDVAVGSSSGCVIP